MQLPVHNTNGEVVGKAEASDVIFGADYNAELLHQAMVYYQANQRQGTSSTLRRGEVSGGGRKPFAQKGTGRARQGSSRSPILRHGGVAFGPHPRSYRKRMPKRMRRQAIRIALSGKVAGERMVVVKDLDDAEPKTHALREVLNALGVTGSALVVMRAISSRASLPPSAPASSSRRFSLRSRRSRVIRMKKPTPTNVMFSRMNRTARNSSMRKLTPLARALTHGGGARWSWLSRPPNHAPCRPSDAVLQMPRPAGSHARRRQVQGR